MMNCFAFSKGSLIIVGGIYGFFFFLPFRPECILSLLIYRSFSQCSCQSAFPLGVCYEIRTVCSSQLHDAKWHQPQIYRASNVTAGMLQRKLEQSKYKEITPSGSTVLARSSGRNFGVLSFVAPDLIFVFQGPILRCKRRFAGRSETGGVA
jgi:hypothetical protein